MMTRPRLRSANAREAMNQFWMLVRLLSVAMAMITSMLPEGENWGSYGLLMARLESSHLQLIFIKFLKLPIFVVESNAKLHCYNMCFFIALEWSELFNS